MKLEKYLTKGKPKHSFECDVKDGVVSTVDLFRQLDEMIPKTLSDRDKADYSHSIVKTIVDNLTSIAIDFAEEKNVKRIGLSGGVTYDIPIVEMVEKQINKSNLELVVHNRVPNGDGCIAIGQNAIIGHRLSNKF
jgi:hydrogenase maturation protein HypF